MEDIAQILAGRNESSISVGEFTGPPTFNATSGPAIRQTLTDEFERRSISVKPRSGVGLKGEYSFTETEKFDSVSGKNQKFLAVEIRGSLVDPFGKTLTDFGFEGIVDGAFHRTLEDEKSIAEMMGVTASLPVGATVSELQRNQALREAAVAPNADIRRGSVVAPSKGSPFSVELIVDGVGRPVEVVDGEPFVDLERGDIYEIRLHNGSDHEAAVALAIDGISTFEFTSRRHATGSSEGQPLYSHYLVPPGQSVTVKGWHRTDSSVDSFLITEYAKSAAALKNSQAKVGTVTALFSAAWTDESNRPAEDARKNGPNATGMGPPKSAVSQPLPRFIGDVRAAVSVRYSRPQ